MTNPRLIREMPVLRWQFRPVLFIYYLTTLRQLQCSINFDIQGFFLFYDRRDRRESTVTIYQPASAPTKVLLYYSSSMVVSHQPPRLDTPDSRPQRYPPTLENPHLLLLFFYPERKGKLNHFSDRQYQLTRVDSSAVEQEIADLKVGSSILPQPFFFVPLENLGVVFFYRFFFRLRLSGPACGKPTRVRLIIVSAPGHVFQVISMAVICSRLSFWLLWIYWISRSGILTVVTLLIVGLDTSGCLM